MEGKYIYGIIAAHNESHLTHLNIPGIDGRGSAFLCSFRRIACLASHYSGADFASLPREEIFRCLLAHQAVVEHAMKEGPVLPVKFGTVLSASSELYQLLELGRPLFLEALDRFRDMVEIEVAVTWNVQRELQEVAREGEIVAVREALAREPGAGLEARLSLGRIVKVALDRRRDQCRERIIGLLRSAAADLQPNALASDEMVMNVAFLVERARQEEFEGRISQLDSLFKSRLQFRAIGPLPPYSFATVEIARDDPEKVVAARQLLGLGEHCSEGEVRRAYRHRAAQAHPDRQPGGEPGQAKLDQLRLAADLLTARCRGQGGDGGLLVTIKRRRLEEVPHLRFVQPETVGVAYG